MSMTLEQIVEEARRLPPEQVMELVDRLNDELLPESEIDAAWKKEARRRIAEIESGAVEGIPGEEVSERIRRIVGR